MSSLLKWQTASFASRLFATIVGLAQSVVIVRILTPSEYGLVGIVSAVGNLAGVLKHLGLVSATTRELAVSESDAEASKVLVSATLIRSVVSTPLVLGLFFLSDFLASNIYRQPTIAIPLKIFSVALLFQSFQELFNAVIAGRQRFKVLFTYQAAIAVVSFAFYVPLVFYFKVTGYFLALLLLTIVSTITLAVFSLRTLSGKIVCPRREELKSFLFSLLGLGLALYAGKILYMLWQKVGTLYLGAKVSPAEVGFFSFALLYATKLMIVSDAVTDVNLPAMTNHLRRGIEEFRRRFVANFEKVYALMLLGGVTALFWSYEIFHLLVGGKYDSSLVLVPPLLLAFFVYGLLNLLDSSVLVPVKLLRELIIYHLVLVMGTGLVLVGAFGFDPLWSVSLAMAFGAAASLFYLSFVCHRKDIKIWSRRTLWPTLVAFLIVLVYFFGLSLPLRLAVFSAFLLFYLWLIPRLGIFDWRRFLSR